MEVRDASDRESQLPHRRRASIFVHGFHVAVLGATCLVVVVASVPSPGLVESALALGSFAGLLAIWTIASVWLAVRARFVATREALLSRIWPMWFVTPIATGVLVLLLGLDLPTRVRFTLSLPAMESMARMAGQHPDELRAAVRSVSWNDPHWIGLFRAKMIEVTDHVFRFSPGGGFNEYVGFACSLTGEPLRDDARNRYKHYVGEWFIWEGDL